MCFDFYLFKYVVESLIYMPVSYSYIHHPTVKSCLYVSFCVYLKSLFTGFKIFFYFSLAVGRPL